jgi:lipopolysaccharide biosynthesis protein/CDP-glycerol glycerophosphotransferase (TagB/SpsB family)
METKQSTLLQQANKAYREKDYQLALELYENLLLLQPKLKSIIKFNIVATEKKLKNKLNKEMVADYPLLIERKNFKNKIIKYKVAFAIHVFYLDIFIDIVEKIKTVLDLGDVVITCSKENKSNVEETLKNAEIEAHLIVVPNIGYDIYPFIIALEYIQANGYGLVLKLHTKKGLANLESVYPDAGNIWFDLLTKPIFNDYETVKLIIDYFESDLDVGMLGSADLYKSAQALMYGNEATTSSLVQAIDNSCDPAKEWGFFAGTIFWARVDVLKPLLKIKKSLDLNPEEQIKTGAINSIWHSLERLMGLLPDLKNSTKALAYSNIDLSINTIKKKEEIKTPNGSFFGVGAVLAAYINIKENLKYIERSSFFDSIFYEKNYSQEGGKVDLAYHYLRYGIFEKCNPNIQFSSNLYWMLNVDVWQARMNPAVHFLKHGKDKRDYFPAEENKKYQYDIVVKSRFFNKEYYLNENKDVRESGIDPVTHYINYGWKENRLTSPDFDVYWYQERYLQGYLEPINPILHYEIIGEKKNFNTRPLFNGLEKKIKLKLKSKRICLFAAYDKDGLIDESVVIFIQELAKFSDVYFLSDSNVSSQELKKLEPFVKGAWAYRHGEYDFGSYKRLAKYQVGWAEIEKYDELLLVNDSSYLISSLEPVFKKMDNEELSWWGMQATKGIYATREKPSNRFKNKILISDVKEKYLDGYFEEEDFDFHIGSYFLAYRKNIITDKKFQNIINGICKQRDKKTLILKYEIGLTKYLISQQYNFDTYMEHLYPFHPIYTDNIYEMIGNGFPLFKRFFLTENHYKQKKLYQWEDRLLKIHPKLDIKPIKENVYRVADASKLFKNLDLESYDQPLLSNHEFIEQDKLSSVDKSIWVFPVCAYNHNLDDNLLAIFEYIKRDPNIKKIILFRSKFIEAQGENIEILPLNSRMAQEYLLKSYVIFVKHSPSINIPFPLDSKKHFFINLWHGIPLKRIGVASLDTQSNLNAIINHHNSKCFCTIASSDIDRLAMCASFYPLKYNDIWLTGLPRHDFILKNYEDLPENMRGDYKRIDNLLEGRKLILYAPTFRNSQKDGYYKFSDDEKNDLYEYLEKNNIVLGIREHMADKANCYSAELVHPNILNMGSAYFGTIEILYRKADLLITDYSSCFIDFMLTDKPMVSFAYDYNNYKSNERGTFYDLDFVFPGDICFNFVQLIDSLNQHAKHGFQQKYNMYDFKKKMFHKFADTNNSKRVVDMVSSIEVNTGA